MATSLKSLLGGGGVPVGGAVDFLDPSILDPPPVEIVDGGATYLRGGFGVVTGTTKYPDFLAAFPTYKAAGTMVLTYAGDSGNFDPFSGAYGAGTLVLAGYEVNGRVGVSTDNGNTLAFYDVSGTYDANVNCLAYGASKFVLIQDNTAYTSADGKTWTPQGTVFASGWETAMVFDGTAFIAGSKTGLISRSTDGQTWSALTSPLSTTIYDMASVGGYRLAWASGPNLAVSSDGSSWSLVSTYPFGSATPVAMVYESSRSRIICVCNDGTTYTSTDGSTWSSNTAITLGGASLATAFIMGMYLHVLGTNGQHFTSLLNPTLGAWSTLADVPGGFATGYVVGGADIDFVFSDNATLVAVLKGTATSRGAAVPALVANGYARYVRIK